LLIGVADDRKIVGLDHDYESLAKSGEDPAGPDKQRDRFQLHLRNLLAARIGQDVSNLCVAMTIVPRDGKDVCLVHASSSRTPVYIAGPKAKAFYLRVGAATVELDVEEVVAYCHQRWPASLLGRILRLTRGT
jgi:predicted HTH transcriptional regulator